MKGNNVPRTITGRPVTKASGIRIPISDYLLAKQVSQQRGISFNQLLILSLKKELRCYEKS